MIDSDIIIPTGDFNYEAPLRIYYNMLHLSIQSSGIITYQKNNNSTYRVRKKRKTLKEKQRFKDLTTLLEEQLRKSPEY